MELQTVTWAPALFRVTGGTRACGGHCFLFLRTSSQSQSSDQQGHNRHHLYKFQFISPPFAASCSACVGKGFTPKQRFSVSLWMYLPHEFNFPIARIVAPQLIRPGLFLDDDRRAFLYKVEQIDDVCIAHPHATVARRNADFILMFGAMNINKPISRVGIVLVQPVEPKDS